MSPAELKPYYGKLQGILSQTPLPNIPEQVDSGMGSLNFYHSTIEEIQKLSGEDLSSYKIAIINDYDSESFKLDEFRQKLNGLIMFLHDKYFTNDPNPFSGTPHAIVNQDIRQNQAQEQSQKQNINLSRAYKFNIWFSFTISITIALYFIFNAIKFILK